MEVEFGLGVLVLGFCLILFRWVVFGVVGVDIGFGRGGVEFGRFILRGFLFFVGFRF